MKHRYVALSEIYHRLDLDCRIWVARKTAGVQGDGCLFATAQPQTRYSLPTNNQPDDCDRIVRARKPRPYGYIAVYATKVL